VADARLNGTVVAFDEHRGLGEIEAGETRYPFHCTQIVDGTRTVTLGASVSFRRTAGLGGQWEAAVIRTR